MLLKDKLNQEFVKNVFNNATQSRRVLPLKLDESLVNADSFNRSEFY